MAGPGSRGRTIVTSRGTAGRRTGGRMRRSGGVVGRERQAVERAGVAVRTASGRFAIGGAAGVRGRRGRRGLAVEGSGGEQGAAEFEGARALAVGEKAVGANADEVGGQDVEEEAAHEFVGVEGEGAKLVGMGIVLPGEGDGLPVHGEEAVVGDGDAVGVAGQVLEGLFGPAEGRFGVDAPVMTPGLSEQAVERLRVLVEFSKAAVKAEATGLIGGPGQREELAAEDAAEHPDGQEEAAAAGDPAAAVERESAGGHEAVHVRVVQQGLPPGVEEGEEADAGAEMTGIGGHLQERLRGGAEEQVVENARILECEGGEGMRQGEDHVRVRHRQQRGPLLIEPFRGGTPLALRAVAIAAGVVREGAVAAAVARVDMTAQCGGPAGEEIPDDALLIATQRRTPSRRFRQPEDLRDLVSRSGSHRSAVASAARSSGLRMLCSRSVETCV